MKKNSIFILFVALLATSIYAQDTAAEKIQKTEIYSLIDQYAQAREQKDTVLLASILTIAVDQLVSSGVWRRGKEEAMQGMLQSSASNPGERTLNIEKIRFLDSGSAIVDTKYQILNSDGSIRNMWSTFIVAFEEGRWKITAIRNMLPAGQQ